MTGPAHRAVLDQALSAAAEEMGVVLQRAAFSPNIKERRDHSCAVFTASGGLVAQAEHIPVHLGAMPSAVDAILDEGAPLEPGEVGVSNSPMHGGTHLPDVTMVRPVFVAGSRVAYVAARAHHADVGGSAPGSMPASASSLAEEGVVIEPCRLREQGAWSRPMAALLEATRSPREREGDLAAQAGALEAGASRVRELGEREGEAGLREGMEAILDHAERLMGARLGEIPGGTYREEEVLETGDGEVAVRLEARVQEEAVELDYEGTGEEVVGGLNAPRPVTVAGAVYVLRVLLGSDVSGNAGMARRLDVSVPEGSVLNPGPGAAVAGGNVETSQRNVDVLFAALGEAFGRPMAQSQGTMNNVTLGASGEHAFAYYETVGGGEGALEGRAGRSGVHTHMTNTQNTPVEALENELPLRVVEQTLRRGSGGEGRWRGGDGIRRALEALVDGVEANLITTRRSTSPKGEQGGSPGAAGENRVERSGGEVQDLGGIARVVLEEGDVLVVETPGGGGWGSLDPEGERGPGTG